MTNLFLLRKIQLILCQDYASIEFLVFKSRFSESYIRNIVKTFKIMGMLEVSLSSCVPNMNIYRLKKEFCVPFDVFIEKYKAKGG